MSEKTKFYTWKEYYLYHVSEVAPFIDDGIINDILEAAEQIRNQDKEKRFAGPQPPGNAALGKKYDSYSESAELIHEKTGASKIDIITVLYCIDKINQYCGGFGRRHRKRKRVGPNITPEKYLRYYTRRIADFTYLKEEDIEAFLKKEWDARMFTIAMNVPLSQVPENRKEEAFKKMDEYFINEITEMTGLDKITARICLRYKRIIEELCGEPG